MSRPITAYESNLDNKDRREEWMGERWPELCAEMAEAAYQEIRGKAHGSARAEIMDALEENEPLAELCYRAETREGEQ